MNEERATPIRRRLDAIRPQKDARLRVYFPAGQPARVMVATGVYDRQKKVFDLRDEETQQVESVPGWLVASELQRKADARWP